MEREKQLHGGEEYSHEAETQLYSEHVGGQQGEVDVEYDAQKRENEEGHHGLSILGAVGPASPVKANQLENEENDYAGELEAPDARWIWQTAAVAFEKLRQDKENAVHRNIPPFERHYNLQGETSCRLLYDCNRKKMKKLKRDIRKKTLKELTYFCLPC